MTYKGHVYPHPYDVLPKNTYISVVAPTYCRPFYLKKMLDTLAEFADMNYEVIIHDDGSPRELQDQVYAMRDRISILSFNTGMNQGLPAAANHCIERASSDYVLFLNDDCFFVRPCLKDICNVLSKDYVGVISPANDTGPLAPQERSVVNGTPFAVSNFLGGGSCVAFRKSVWKEVGGWDERSTSGQADNVFIYKILRAGYWKALMEGPDRIKVGNFVYPEPSSGHADAYKPTQGYSRGNDCSIPKIFGIPEREYIRLNHIRREACQYWVDGERTIDEGNGRSFYDDRPNPVAGLNDIPYWGNYFLEMYGNKHSNDVTQVNWDVAARHGQSRHREAIQRDFRI
jgi:glycosyltransferase involved in cell wall biosynthesis